MTDTNKLPPSEREAFEAFAQNCPMGKYRIARRGDGYDSSHTQLMWDTWQARAQVQGEAATVAVDHFDNGPFEAYTNRIHPPVEIGTKLYTTPQPAQAITHDVWIKHPYTVALMEQVKDLSSKVAAQATQAEVTDAACVPEKPLGNNWHAHHVLLDKATLQLVRNAFRNDLERGMSVRGEILDALDKAILALRHAAVPMTDEQRVVASFLLGEGDLNGASFGDPHNPTHGGQFWWRKHLRNAFGITAQAKKEGNHG